MSEHSIVPGTSPSPAHPDCASCAISNRRAFVQTAVASVTAFLGVSLLSATDAVAQITALVSPAAGARGNSTYPVPAADGVSIDTTNDVILARSGANVYAFALACPHQNTALRWYPKDHRFQCPKHKSRYAPSGEFQTGRATRNMDRLAIRLEGTSVIVDNTREIRSDAEPAKWAAAVVQIKA